MKNRLSHLFVRGGFFYLGAYLVSVPVWFLLVSPVVYAPQAPSKLALIGLSVAQAAAVGLGGGAGLWMLTRRLRSGSGIPIAAYGIAGIGYLLALSLIP